MILKTRKSLKQFGERATELSKRKKKKFKLRLFKSKLELEIIGIIIVSVAVAGATYFLSHLFGVLTDNGGDIITSNALSVIAFFVTILLFLRTIARDINHLSSDLKQITDGKLDLKIKLIRKDELGDLARDISVMQNSLLRRMESERKAIESNRELITSLSHDLRTPLTKQMCAVELALKNPNTDASTAHTLEMIYHSAEQIKEMSDELFSCFLAENSAHEPHLEAFDGQTLFGQLLSEHSDFLKSSGFEVILKSSQNSTFTIKTDSSYLARIMDNLTSNVRKYADCSKPVLIKISADENSLCLLIQNTTCNGGASADSSNVGIHSAEKMAELLGGSLKTELCGNIFCAKLTLPIENS